MMLLEGRRERCGGRKTLRGSNKEKKSTEWLGDSLETTTKKKENPVAADCVSWFVSLFPFPTLPRPMPLSMPPASIRVAPCRSSLSARPRLQCAAGRPPTTAPAVTELPGCRDRHRRRSPPTPDSRPAPQPPTTAAGGRARRLLRPPRAIGFDLLGGSRGRNDGDGGGGGGGAPSPLFPGGSPSSSSPSSPPPRELLLAAGRLILLRDLLADAADSPAAAALALLRAVASPGGRNDGAASSAGAALAAALAARPPSSSGAPSGWRGFLLDEVVVGRNNPLARSVARGGLGGGGGGGDGFGGGGGGGGEAAAASAAGAALAADLSALQSLAFDGAAAASGVRGADPAVPGPWLEVLAAAVDGGKGRGEGGESSGSSSPSSPSSPPSVDVAFPPPSPRLLPPLTRAQRARAAASLSSHRRWADGAPELIALWSAHGSGNVGSYFAFEWNPNSSPNSIAPCVEDRGGGAPAGAGAGAGGEEMGGTAAALWAPVASGLAAWARGDRLAPFDGGSFAARVEAPPSSLGGGGGGGDSGDNEKDEKKKKKKEGGGGSSSSSASPSPSLSLWDGLRTSPVLLASGARLVRLPAAGNQSSLPLRALWRALRLHPRARWVVVSDDFPLASSGGEAALAMEGELPPGVSLAVRRR